jgi:RNA polymerase sigma-70 factor (ECF subfamily)
LELVSTHKVLSDFASYTVREQRHVTNRRTLLKRAQEYDLNALGEIYDEYAPRIYAYLYRRVQNAQLAEDLTGEVFVRMLQAIQAKRFWHTSFQGWLYRIAHNLTVDHHRRQPPEPTLVLDEELVANQDDVDSAVAEQLSRQRLQAAIRRLTPDQQQVVTLRFGEQLTTRETSEVMNKSVSAVEALQHRALVALRRILEKEYNETII